LGTALNHILEDLADEESQPPEGLARIVDVEMAGVVTNGESADDPAPQMSSGPDPDVLFSKPANAEQYEIATRLSRAKSVLVQGPPGTGKTYTIGNLLGLLLSQGKTVLVTAHTTKALKVLRGQVDEALQPLCLSVLEGDTESQAQLSRAAQAIATRLSRSDAASLRREAAALRGKRRELLAKQDQLQRQLRDARFSEVEEVVFNGEGLNPLDVARRVHLQAERDGWIPGPLEHSSLCPLTAAEIAELYRSQGVITDDDDRQLAFAQPMLSKLVASSDFQDLAEEHSGAQSFSSDYEGMKAIEEWEVFARTGLRRALRPMFGMAFGRIPVEESAIAAANVALNEDTAGIEHALSNGPWLMGDRITAADVMVAPMLFWATQPLNEEAMKLQFAPIMHRFDLGANRERTRDWVARVMAWDCWVNPVASGKKTAKKTGKQAAKARKPAKAAMKAAKLAKFAKSAKPAKSKPVAKKGGKKAAAKSKPVAKKGAKRAAKKGR